MFEKLLTLNWVLLRMCHAEDQRLRLVFVEGNVIFLNLKNDNNCNLLLNLTLIKIIWHFHHFLHPCELCRRSSR